MLGIELTPEHPVSRIADLGVLAEDAGFDTVFVTSHYFNRDPFVALTAIGGIDSQRAADVLATGVGSCAMISAITQAEEPERVVDELLALHAEASPAIATASFEQDG